MKKLSPETLRQHKGISFVGVTTSFICHDGKGHIFMAKRTPKCRDEIGRWDNGGGGLKWGQKAKENAIREIKEEYSVTPQKIDFLGYRDVFRIQNDTKTHWLSLDFLAEVDPKKVKINEPDFFTDSGWFSLDNLPQPLHSQFPTILKKYRAALGRIWAK